MIRRSFLAAVAALVPAAWLPRSRPRPRVEESLAVFRVRSTTEEFEFHLAAAAIDHVNDREFLGLPARTMKLERARIVRTSRADWSETFEVEYQFRATSSAEALPAADMAGLPSGQRVTTEWAIERPGGTDAS